MSQPADDPVTIGPPPSPSPVPCFSDPMIAEADGGRRPSSLCCDLLDAAWLPQRPTAGPAGARWDPMLLEAPACPLESVVADVASPFSPAAVNEQAQVALESVRFSLSPSEPVRDTVHDHVLGDSTPSRRNITMARGTRDALPLHLVSDIPSYVDDEVAIFAHDVCRKAPRAVLVASPPRRSSRQQPQDFVIRRSERLAKKSRHRATNPATQAQNVMMRKLGITSDIHPPDASAFQQFEEAFTSSLLASHCEALDALLPTGMGRLATEVATPLRVS